MNKEKVIGLSNRINDVVINERPTYISWHKIAYASEMLKEELNSKPAMPKVFDEWVKSFALNSRFSEHKKAFLIASLGDYISDYEFIYYFDIPSEEEFIKWVYEDLDSRTLICVEAILNGYEVEDDG